MSDEPRLQRSVEPPSRPCPRPNSTHTGETDGTDLAKEQSFRSEFAEKDLNPSQDFTAHQLHQLNTAPRASFADSEKAALEASLVADPTESSSSTSNTKQGVATPIKPVLSNPFPGNLPLSLLRALEACVRLRIKQGRRSENGAKGLQGWSVSEGERGITMVRSLSKLLAEMEHIGDGKLTRVPTDTIRSFSGLLADPPPLSLSVHLSQLLFIHLLAIPAQMIPVLGAWTPVIAVIVAWALLGVEGMSRDVGLVFGSSGGSFQ